MQGWVWTVLGEWGEIPRLWAGPGPPDLSVGRPRAVLWVLQGWGTAGRLRPTATTEGTVLS